MIPEYINNWFYIIENMKNENTYKLAWGRALLECIFNNQIKKNNDKTIISLNAIAKNMLKYYWNQLFFFKLKQSPNRVDNRQPYIVQFTNELIDYYILKTKSEIPIWFDRAEKIIEKTILDKTIDKIVNILPKNVSWRFKVIGNKEIPLYEYDKNINPLEVIFDNSAINLLKEYDIVISKLLNFKWSQLLENFNCAPKIANKVSSISDIKIKRKSLNKYKNELMKEFKDGQPIDFYSGKYLNRNDISVDHVIPWSFMYSDDIWNLVLTSKSNNSLKSNSIPSEEIIAKLKERNKKIVKLLDERYSFEMNEAIKNGYIDKYYFDCRI